MTETLETKIKRLRETYSTDGDVLDVCDAAEKYWQALLEIDFTCAHDWDKSGEFLADKIQVQIQEITKTNCK